MFGFIKVKKDAQGFGFISVPEYEKDLFFHFSGCVDHVDGFNALAEEMDVSFEIADTQKGPIAINVQEWFGEWDTPSDSGAPPKFPDFTLKALLEFGAKTNEGILIRAVGIPWFEIIRTWQKNPEFAYQIDPYMWEEIIAGAYTRAGFDEVILTPRSGDKGRDVIAIKYGIGSIKIFDQVKAYKPGHVVTANEVRAMLGVITGAQNVSKGVITTTSSFAPRLMEDEYLKPYIPYRLELKPGEILFPWLGELALRDTDLDSF